MESGVKYTIWGTVKLITSPIIEKNVVYSYAEPEFVGRMPILKDLTVKLTETANKLERGLFMFEFIGMYLASHKAVGKLILDYSNGDDLIKVPNVADGIMAKEGNGLGRGTGTVL